jgi:hypothetical protein
MEMCNAFNLFPYCENILLCKVVYAQNQTSRQSYRAVGSCNLVWSGILQTLSMHFNQQNGL